MFNSQWRRAAPPTFLSMFVIYLCSATEHTKRSDFTEEGHSICTYSIQYTVDFVITNRKAFQEQKFSYKITMYIQYTSFDSSFIQYIVDVLTVLRFFKNILSITVLYCQASYNSIHILIVNTFFFTVQYSRVEWFWRKKMLQIVFCAKLLLAPNSKISCLNVASFLGPKAFENLGCYPKINKINFF